MSSNGGVVGVVGLGLIGGSIAKRLISDATFNGQLLGYDNDENVAAQARARGIEIATSTDDLAKRCDYVFVAVPPRRTASIVTQLLAASGDVLVADAASVKTAILDRVSAGVSKDELQRFLPAHPLAGSEESGWESSSRALLNESIWAICPTSPEMPLQALCCFGELLDLFSARLIVCTAEDHDRAVARTSHAPHILSEVLVASLDHHAPSLSAALSGGAFRDMTRIAGSDFALWSEILELNEDAVTEVLSRWSEALAGLSDTPLVRPALERAWSHGVRARTLVEEKRWNQVQWEARALPLPVWNELLAIGQSGTAIRRPQLDSAGRVLNFQVGSSQGA